MKKAAGLQYKTEDHAPKLIALGQGQLAEKIIQVAQDNQIPIIQDTSLAEQLTKLQLNQEIPSELYQAVAEILAFIYHYAPKSST